MLDKCLSKTDPLPLYQQLAQLIEHAINTGSYENGDALPTEKEFCEAYSISRVTVREAMNVLKRLELVETRRGSGNYVSKATPVNRDLLGVHDFDLQIEASGHTNEIELIHFEKNYISTAVAKNLQVTAKTPLIKVMRVRKAGQVPLFIETIFLVAQQFDALTEADFLSTKVFSKKLRDTYGVEITEITLVLDPVLLSSEQATFLHVSELPAAGLMNERISFDQHNKPVVFSQWLFSRHRCRHLLKIKAK